jgi:hypothetical protein
MTLQMTPELDNVTQIEIGHEESRPPMQISTDGPSVDVK